MDTATPGMAPGRQTVVGLDILRLLAALLVVSYHFLFFSWVEPAGYGGIRDAVSADIAFPQALPFAWWGWVGVDLFFVIRSDERRVGTECVSTCRSRWWRQH